MELKTPVFIVNLKTYKESTGKNALLLAKACEEAAQKTGKSISVAVQPTDLREISSKVSIPALAQHIDGVSYGAATGHILPESAADAGAVGSLLNHSEDQYDFEALKKASDRMKELGLVRVICANTPEKACEIAQLCPEFIAIEPPELIGGTVSVSTAKPEVITDTVNLVKKVNKDIKILCGAGVNSRKDVEIALKLGAEGILIASAVVKSKNPKEVVEELTGGF